MKLKRAIASLCLSSIMISGLLPCAAAYTEQQNMMADELHAIGLFQGKKDAKTGLINYDLDGLATRDEAITMLIRLMGVEEQAKSGNCVLPFKDVENWAIPYVGYAYENKLTSGTSATQFGGTDLVNPNQYITFVLRALGYKDGTDFNYPTASTFSDQLGVTSGQYGSKTKKFTRGDIVEISYNALKCKQKSGETLIKTLCNQHVVNTSYLNKMDLIRQAGLVTLDQPRNLNVTKQNGKIYLSWDDSNSDSNTYGLCYDIEVTDDLNKDFELAEVSTEKKCELTNDLYQFTPNTNHYIRVQASDFNKPDGRVYRSEYSSVFVYNSNSVQTTPSLSIDEITDQISSCLQKALEADNLMLNLCQKSELSTSEDDALSYAKQANEASNNAVEYLEEAINLCDNFTEYTTAKRMIIPIQTCHLDYSVDNSNYRSWTRDTINSCDIIGQLYKNAAYRLAADYVNYLANHQ